MPTRHICSIFVISSCLLTAVACDLPSYQTKDEYFAEMNRRLDQAAQEADGLEQGKDKANARKLERIRQLIEDVENLKYNSFDTFSDLWGHPFEDWYTDYDFVDWALRVAWRIAALERGNDEDRRRGIKEWLELAKSVKEDIEERVRPHAPVTGIHYDILVNLEFLNRKIDALIAELDRNPPVDINSRAFQNRLTDLDGRKHRSLHMFPSVDGTPFWVWYSNLSWLDTRLEHILDMLDRLERSGFRDDDFGWLMDSGSLKSAIRWAKDAKVKVERRWTVFDEDEGDGSEEGEGNGSSEGEEEGGSEGEGDGE